MGVDVFSLSFDQSQLVHGVDGILERASPL